MLFTIFSRGHSSGGWTKKSFKLHTHLSCNHSSCDITYYSKLFESRKNYSACSKE
jgi:hypothetical protein